MNHQDIDREIAHLERVFRLISNNGSIPVSYWRDRLHELSALSLMPIHRTQIARLEATLRVLEEPEQAMRGEPILKSTGTRP